MRSARCDDVSFDAAAPTQCRYVMYACTLTIALTIAVTIAHVGQSAKFDAHVVLQAYCAST